MKTIGVAALLMAAIHGGGLLAAGSKAAVTVTESTICFFSGLTGANPAGGLVMDTNGALYGTTNLGGAANFGVIFQLTPPSTGSTAWADTVLYNFAGGSDGANGYGSLVFDSRGNLYGATLSGGASNMGTIFELAPPAAAGGSWTETLLHTFAGGSDGSGPTGSLVFGPGGVLYGTTISGGTSNNGTVFELQPPKTVGAPWSYLVLYSFLGGSSGASPATGVTLGPNGSLYGTTYSGGTANAGAVFQLTPGTAGQPWTEAVMYSFTGGSDGGFPHAELMGANGVVFGTTSYGGAANEGTVFQLTMASSGTSWNYKVLHSFGIKKDGANPYGPLLLSKGWLYGVTAAGGPKNQGTVFGMKTPSTAGGAWTEVVIHNFAGGSTDGAQPISGVLISPTGMIYGTTFLGGPNDEGTVFQVAP